jgi:DNA (cytosine-5)-methyltransferase 1
MSRLPVGLELFCGCGGLSTGFLDAGLRVAAGFDVDRRAIEAYEYNHAYRGSRGFVADLSRASGTELLQRAGAAQIDVLVGGPPCQPFSIVGKRRGREDGRAELVFHFLRLAGELSPQAVFFENVPNFAGIDDARLLAQLVEGLERLKYVVCTDVMPAAAFGVPQVRRRLLLVGVRGVRNVRLPQPTHAPADLAANGLLPYLTARDALDDLPDGGDFGQCGIHNHELTEHTADMLARFATLRVGEREPRSFHDRLHPERPSFTLRAGTGNFSPLRPIHYKFDRVITVRESARLQGFGDQFIWPDGIPRLQQYRQVGNAVPPPLAEAVARSLADQLGWQLDPGQTRGHPEERPEAITLSDAERRARRISRIRGASLGRSASRSPQKSS